MTSAVVDDEKGELLIAWCDAPIERFESSILRGD